MKKLIIVYGCHLSNIVKLTTSTERLEKILSEKGFKITDNLVYLDIIVFKNSEYKDHSKLTHIVINFGDLVSEIHYYTKTE